MAFADNQISRSGWDLCAYTFQHEQTREMGSELNTKYQQSVIKSFPFHNVHICKMARKINSETIFEAWVEENFILKNDIGAYFGPNLVAGTQFGVSHL